ncbi:ATP-binding protein [Marinibactrum halimedae]|uniref:ATP-binding protein n=1 Tax=Marinibactrum halimedae TaxID=1444977 RepID=A0AA37T4D0_9GAMM|nr:ATP-binding protein [Marinibactrum halimedae]MCD9457395.1 ATP-binding protein [Marinibactrum halimedae]GLS25554.1 ATP-binding protein [Marinibactrum halimedae]
MIDWNLCYAAVWRPRKAVLRAVTRLDSIRLEHLLQVDTQKQKLVDNTERFLKGLPANNALLWGSRGTGKSSLIKALLNEYADQGLRVIEVDKDDLVDLPDIVDEIRELDFRFIVFCDDLSFEPGESSYKHLKSVLEGSIELPPENILLYATSNRRHLIPQTNQDNLDTLAARMADKEIHYADNVEEKLSLADRFGLWLSFYPINWPEYLSVVDHLFENYSGDKAALHESAKLFAMTRGNHSARTAKQFYQSVVNVVDC